MNTKLERIFYIHEQEKLLINRTDKEVLFMEEIWKPIPGYDGYEVSNTGKVKSYKIKKRRSITYSKKY